MVSNRSSITVAKYSQGLVYIELGHERRRIRLTYSRNLLETQRVPQSQSVSNFKIKSVKSWYFALLHFAYLSPLVCFWALASFFTSQPKSPPWLRKFGNLSIRKILPVVTSAYVRTDSGGGGEESQDNPTRGGECHLFLAGNRAVVLGTGVRLG